VSDWLPVSELRWVEIDDGELFRDSPIGLQVTCRTQEDEAVLAMAKVIVDALENEKGQDSVGKQAM